MKNLRKVFVSFMKKTDFFSIPLFFLFLLASIFFSACQAPAASESSSPEKTSELTTEKDNGVYTDPSTLPNTMASWWFKRNENHEIPEVQNEIDLTKYDAWYAKTDITDGEKPVFLTFDCGYENGYTPGILDVLKKHKAPAAFFVCKHFIEDQPDLIKRMKEEGHVVGNHTSNHICMPESDERTIREEIADNANYMKEATGYEMDPSGRQKGNTVNVLCRSQKIWGIPPCSGASPIRIMT